MYYKLICILYALLCGQNFILVNSGCYTRHLRWLPGKHIHISPEEGDECEFQFVVQIACAAEGLHAGDVLFVGGLHTQGVDDKPCWRELEGARSRLPGLAAASCYVGRAWSFSSVEMAASHLCGS
jgi:hypothetical protein